MEQQRCQRRCQQRRRQGRPPKVGSLRLTEPAHRPTPTTIPPTTRCLPVASFAELAQNSTPTKPRQSPPIPLRTVSTWHALTRPALLPTPAALLQARPRLIRRASSCCSSRPSTRARRSTGGPAAMCARSGRASSAMPRAWCRRCELLFVCYLIRRCSKFTIFSYAPCVSAS